jgi:hypothetical protein
VWGVSSINLPSTSDPGALWPTLVARFGFTAAGLGIGLPAFRRSGLLELVRLARATTEGPGPQADVLGATARRIWPALL